MSRTGGREVRGTFRISDDFMIETISGLQSNYHALVDAALVSRPSSYEAFPRSRPAPPPWEAN